jgi:type IV pilus assembly protein PilW
MIARQRGLAVAEVLIAMMLSLLVVLAASTLLLASNGDFLHNGANTRIDDNGRFALAIIGQALRQAGYPGEPGESGEAGASAAPPPGVLGRDAASVARNAEGMGDPLTPVNASDVLAVRYAPSAIGVTDAGSAMLNCAGFPAEASDWAWSVFYVAKASDGVAELRCKYQSEHGWGADAVVRGVDAFHVLYGVDTDTPRDHIPNLYLTASAIDARDAALSEDERLQQPTWRRVASVRIALLLHGEPGSRNGGRLARYEMLPNADPQATLDEASLPAPMRHRARRLFGATVALRNQ